MMSTTLLETCRGL